MSNVAGRSTASSNAAITSATSPSPKLDSTPATWTSASGQICWMMPVMNVPWPASKSSVPLPSSSYSSSSSIAPGGRSRSHGECSRAHVRYGCSTAAPVAAVGAQAGVEDEDRRRPCAPARPSGCGQPRRLRRRVRRRPQHLADRRVDELGGEHHPAGEVGLGADGHALDALAAEHDVVRLGGAPAAAELVERRLHRRHARSAARRGSSVGLVRHADRRRGRRVAARASRSAAACSLVVLADRPRDRGAERRGVVAGVDDDRVGPHEDELAVAVDAEADAAAHEHLGEIAQAAPGDRRPHCRCSRVPPSSCTSRTRGVASEAQVYPRRQCQPGRFRRPPCAPSSTATRERR